MEPAATLPNNIALLLRAVGTLLTYGIHLLNTVRQRSTAPNFNTIAACFGTANLSTILAHLNRGIQRAAALERLLVIRAATGRNIDVVVRGTPTPPAQPAATLQLASPPAPHTRAPRPVGWNDPELFMPSIRDIERQVRRRPLGRTILDICLDLAVVPGFCTGEFWNELFDAMHHFGGSVATLMQQKSRREQAFAKQQDHVPNTNWDWLRLKRDAVRQVLGFFIGEPPINPLAPDAATATGPPL
jgi:hypothetical protein